MNFPIWIYPPDGRSLIVHSQEQYDYEMAVDEDGRHLAAVPAPPPEPVVIPLEPEHRPKNTFMPAPVTIEPIFEPLKRKPGRPLGAKNKR